MRRMLMSIMAGAVMLATLTGWTRVPGEHAPAGQIVPPELYWAAPAADVIIDAGHGGIDAGTTWGEVKEKDITLAIARKLYLLLRSHGIKAVLNRTGDYALSDDNRWHVSRSRHRRDLSQRGSLTDEIETSMLVSIHVNWANDRSDRGGFVMHQNEGRSAMLAGFVQDSLNHQQSMQHRPRVAKRFYLLNRVRVPSIIVETAFLSNPADRESILSPRGQTRVAEAIASGIMAYRYLAP